MVAYRVLVSHRDLKMKTVVHFEPDEQVRYLVDAGYLRPIEEVTEVAGTAVLPELPDPVLGVGPRRVRKKAEVNDGESGPVPGGDPEDGES